VLTACPAALAEAKKCVVAGSNTVQHWRFARGHPTHF
jgi:hypothetical protein